MKLLKKSLVLLLAFTLMIPTFLIPTLADDASTKYFTDASIEQAKGGADAIATMTFDDGKVKTAQKLNELLAKYDGKASLMLISDTNIATADQIEFWKLVLSEGYLTAESHSATHDYLTSNLEVTNPEHLCEEKYIYETKGALDKLLAAFPDQDVLAFTIPYSNYVPDARKHVMANYYAALAGECVLTTPSHAGKVMSLDPPIGDPATGSTPAGSWHNVLYTRLQPIYSTSSYPQLTMENIIGYLGRCVEQGGWFITSCHGIFPGENQDLTVEQLEMLLSAMSVHQKAGKLWIASFSEATKYIRERQNSTVSAYTYGEGEYFVELTMADKTADGLSLTKTVAMPDGSQRAVFDMPLTVKVELPESWAQVKYTQGGSTAYSETFIEMGKTYAYVDLVPNGGTATLVASEGGSAEDELPEAPAGSYEAPEGAYVPADGAVTYAIFASEEDYLDCKTPVKEFTTTNMTIADTAVGGYIHVFADGITAEKLLSDDKTTAGKVILDLAGKSINLPTGVEVEGGEHLTIKNGTVICRGQMHVRADAELLIDNVIFTNHYQSFGWGIGANSVIFRNSRLEMMGQGCYFHLTGNTEANAKNAPSTLAFKNTDLVIGSTVHETYGLFRIAEANWATTRWQITFDAKSTVIGDISHWVHCIESAEQEYNNASEYQRFKYTQQILFEEGVFFSNGAKPDFTYDIEKLGSDNSTVTLIEDLPASDSTLEMAVTMKGTTYKLIGDVVFTDANGGGIIGVPNGKADLPAGTYIKPEGVWEPTDSTVTYAKWASENAYLKGNEPYKTYYSTEFDTVEAKSGGYYVLYSNLSTQGTDDTFKIIPAANTNLTVNLAGYTITTGRGFGTDTGATLKVMNGHIDNSGQQNYKYGTVIFENVYFKHSSNATFGYGCCPTLWEIRDSVVEINRTDIYFYLGGNPISGSASELNFINTDFVIGTGSVSPTYGLFRIAPQSNKTAPFVITFDKDSSFTGDIPLLASVTESLSATFGATQIIRFEEGFTYSGTTPPAFEYLKTVREGEEGSYTLSTPTVVPATDSLMQVMVVAPGETAATEYEWEFTEVESGKHVLTINDPTDEPDTPVEPDEPETWTPAAGTVYAIWASKEDYDAGKAPIAEYTTGITLESLTASNSSYVRLFASTSFATRPWISGSYTVVIDLGGFVLSDALGVELDSGADLTIENGTYNHTAGQIYFKPTSYMTWRDLTINESSSKQLSYGYGCNDLVYERCTVTLTNAENYFLIGSPDNYTACAIRIIDSEFIINADLVSELFTLRESPYNRQGANLTVTIDEDSTVTGSGTIPGLVGLYENFLYSGGNGTAAPFEKVQTFNIDCAVSRSLLAHLTVYNFHETDFDASVEASAAAGKTVTVYKDVRVLAANDERCKTYLDGELIKAATLYANPKDSTNTAYSLAYAMDKVNVGWYRLDGASGILFGTIASKHTNGMAIFPNSVYRSLTPGETVYFAQDVVILEDIVGSVIGHTGFTFDLGGNEMLIPAEATDGFDLALWTNGAYQYHSLTWRNGTITSDLNQPFYGGGHNDSVFTFDGITFNHSGTYSITSMYRGTFVVKNCVVNAPNAFAAFGFEKASDAEGLQTFKIENTTFNCRAAVRIYLSAMTDLSPEEFYVKGSVINATEAAVKIEGGIGATDANYINMLIKDSSINAPLAVNVSSGIAGYVNVLVDNTLLRDGNILGVDLAASAGTDKWRVTLADGQTLMGIDGVEGYSYKVAKRPAVASDAFMANLTLYTDFTLNFFANPEVITALYVNGEALTAEVFEGLNKYSIRGISAANAADAIELVVWIKSGDVTYKVPVSYSVLTYANSVIAKDDLSVESKQLVTSAMEYVKAAYTYTGKTAPAFTGVALTAATAPATTAVTLPELIAGARLSLGENLKLRFTLAEGKSGNLTVGDASYVVENGKVGELGYVEVDMRAYLFYDAEIVVSDGTTTGTYTLAHYVNAVKGNADANLVDLVNDFYTYTKYASEYKKTGSLN